MGDVSDISSIVTAASLQSTATAPWWFLLMSPAAIPLFSGRSVSAATRGDRIWNNVKSMTPKQAPVFGTTVYVVLLLVPELALSLQPLSWEMVRRDAR
jgi:hypothetical protein